MNAGSGTTLAVAHNMGRQATGIDIDQATYGMTVNRLGPLIAQLELDVHWPHPNWNAPALPPGDGNYQPWAHMQGDQPGTLKWAEGGNRRSGGGNPPYHISSAGHTPRDQPRPPRPTIEVPGQGTLL